MKSFLIKSGGLFGSYKNRIIFYHDLCDNDHTPFKINDSTHFDLFTSHIQIARLAGYKFIDVIPEDNRQLMICFDDGYRGILNYLSFFEENKIFVRIFIITGFIGKTGYLSKKEINMLQQTGLFQFGFHSHNHINLDCIKDLSTLHNEIIQSRDIISEITGVRNDYFCVPRGRYSYFLLDFLSENNIPYVFTAIPGKMLSSYKNLTIVSRSICQNASPALFKSILKGGDNILRYYYQKKHFSE